MKATVLGEILLLVAVLALAYLVWAQREELIELAGDIQRVEGLVRIDGLIGKAMEMEKPKGAEVVNDGAGANEAVPDLRGAADDPGQGAVPEPGAQ